MEVEDVELSEQQTYQLHNIPPPKLLHYVKKDDLVAVLGSDNYNEIAREANQRGQKLTSKFLKAQAAQRPGVVESIRASDVGRNAFDKYRAAYDRITSKAVQEKSRDVRRLMQQPRRGYKGCISTRVKPKDIEYCTQNYDRPEYQNIDLVPSSLRSSVYEKTNHPQLHVSGEISQLPRGLKTYIQRHPEEYDDYLEERKAEVEYLKTVRRNALRAYRSGMKLTPEEMFRQKVEEEDVGGTRPKRSRPEFI